MKRINFKAFFISALSLFSLNGFASSVECDTLVSDYDHPIFVDYWRPNSLECNNLSCENGHVGNLKLNRCDCPSLSIYRSPRENRAGIFTMQYDTTGGKSDFNMNYSIGEGDYAPITFKASYYTFDFGSSYGRFNNGKVMTVNGKIVCNEELKVVEINTEKIRAKEMNVEMNQAADYVFDENYDLKSLDEVESYVKQNKHLPGVPSADEFSDKGMNVSQMSNLLLEKVEELTLHMIQMRKEMDMLKEENSSLKEEINQLRKK